MSARTVLLVEDDPRTRAHLERAVVAHEQLELAASTGTCAEARTFFRSETVHVLLVDLGLPDGSGIDIVRELRELQPESLIMVITVSADERSVIRSVEAGAHGYLLKQGTLEEIGQALTQLLDGGSPISAQIARHLLRRFRDEHTEASADDSAPHLTTRETEVLKLIAKGFSYAEIAKLLGVSGHTVNTHVRHIYAKLEVGSRNAAVYEAVNLGLIRMDD